MVKKYGFYYLFLGLFVFLVLILLERTQDKPADVRILTEKFSRQLLTATTTAQSLLQTFSGAFDTTTNLPSGQVQKELNRILLSYEITLMTCKGDSLVYWSDNKVPLYDPGRAGELQGPVIVKLKNGWYEMIVSQKGSYRFIAVILVKSGYPFQNDYLKNSYARGFDLPQHASLSLDHSDVRIKDEAGRYLVSMRFPDAREAPATLSIIMFLLFLAGGGLLLVFINKAVQAGSRITANPLLVVIIVWASTILLRIIQFHFRFPSVIYRNELFGMTWYSSSVLQPSLGDFLVNVLLVVYLTHVLFCLRNRFVVPKNAMVRFALSSVLMILLVLSFLATLSLVRSLVQDSVFPMNLQNISNLIPVSILGLFITGGLFLSFWYFSVMLLGFLTTPPFTRINLISAAGLSVFLFVIYGFSLHQTSDLFFLGFLVLYVGGYLYFRVSQPNPVSHGFILFCLFFFSITGTYFLNEATVFREREKRKVLAVKLATRRNPVTEVLFSQLFTKIRQDAVIQRSLNTEKDVGQAAADSLPGYITRTYFTDYWSRFNVQVTVCNKEKTLQVQPAGYLVNCDAYFSGIIRNFGKASLTGNLYFLDYGFGSENYLAILPIQSEGGAKVSRSMTLYIEFNPKPVYKDLGYPELLVDKTRIERPDLTDYSYAFFKKNRLVYSTGSHTYSHLLWNNIEPGRGWPFIVKNGTDHYYYRINTEDALLVSRNEPTFLVMISPFSYLFILFAFLSFVLYGVLNFKNLTRFRLTSLRNRLQLSMIGILVFSFIIIGIVLIVNIVQLNAKKNDDILREKAQSVLIELQHKISSLPELSDVSPVDLENLLIKFSNVFFSDINLYDQAGFLVATSRPQIFEEGLISEWMNADALRQMKAERQSLYIHEESIGTNRYSSAYLPFYNDQSTLLGYVNLPYFSRQDELKKEISTFLVTFINIYVLFILLGVFVVFLVSKYITSSLTLLAGKISKLQLGHVNEKIDWKRSDEIGRLVEEYNRMIDELARSAEKLASSERESAWREMARQVAHEIKNPLTPMKLSIQYLQKAWDEGAPDIGHRIDKFSKTLVEQIDTLSSIASEFSDFAQMPDPVEERVELNALIKSVLGLYIDSTRIRFTHDSDFQNAFIFADKKQLVRVFTNLFNNAVQAIGETAEGEIRVVVTREGDEIRVDISDTGSGIPKDLQHNIFLPDFTTKSGGSGLGLAIVRGIMNHVRGRITFTSIPGEGTTFSLFFPMINEI
jgi:signal transduction histidine kinase